MKNLFNFLKKPQQILLAISLFAYLILMSFHVIEMNDQYTQAGDLAAYNHVIGNVVREGNFTSTLCGSIYQFSNTVMSKSSKDYPVISEEFHSFGMHFMPGLALTNSLPYLIFPHVNTTLVMQTLAIAVSAFLLFYITLLFGLNSWFALGLSISFLLHPATLGANVNAFHPVVMALPFLFGMVLSMQKEKWIFYWLCFSVALLIQENVSTVLIVFSLIPFLSGHKKTAAFQFVISSVFFVLVTKVIIPSYNPNGICPYCSIYGSPLGGSLSEIIRNALLNPPLLFSTLTRPDVLIWLLKLLTPTLLLTLLSPPYFLVVLAALAPNLLSTNGAMHSFWGQYNSLAMPFIYLGAAHSGAWIQKKWKVRQLAQVILGLLVIGNTYYWALQLSPMHYTNPKLVFDPRMNDLRTKDEVRFFNEIRDRIPSDASVSANEYLLSQIHDRKKVYIFPVYHLQADYVVAEKKSFYPGLYSQELLVRMIEETKASGYEVVFENDLAYLLKRGTP